MFVPFLIISSVLTPPFVWLLVYCQVLPQGGRTLAEERADIIKCTLSHGGFYLWTVWAAFWAILTITAYA